MTSIQPNIPTNTQTIVQPKQPEAKPKEKSSIGTGVKVAVGVGLTALAATGIYIATKGKGGKNVKNLGEQIESLTRECSNYFPNHSFEFETPQIGERLEEISKLPKKEQLSALQQLKTILDHADVVNRHIYLEHSLPKGSKIGLPKDMKTLPDDVRQAYEAKDVIKTGELFKQHLDKLPNSHPAITKGATVAESIENTFGKGSNIQPHTYDLSKESPVIGVYRYHAGYKDGMVGQEGRYFTDILTQIPDQQDVNTSISHAFNGNNYGSMSELYGLSAKMLENPDRKLVRFVLPDPNQGDTKIILTILSPNSEYTPLQKDMIKLIENPKKIDVPVFDKLTTVAETRQDLREDNLYKYLDYDVLLSSIQSMANRV